jgi:hypothetical protein
MWADSANVTVAMSDPTNLAVVDEIRFRTARRVKVCIGGEHEIAAALQALYPGEAPIALDLDIEADDGGEVAVDPFGVGGAPPPRAGSAAPAPRTAAIGAAIDLEDTPRASARAAEKEDDAVELTSLQEPAAAGDAAPGTERCGAGEDASRELSARELAILDSLERLAHGAAAEPEIVKPVQAIAAMIRLLIRKRVVTEQEFLDELSKK